MRAAVHTAIVLASGVAILAWAADVQDRGIPDSARAHLKPRTTPLPEPTVGRTVYVPVDSSIYLGLDGRTVKDEPSQ